MSLKPVVPRAAAVGDVEAAVDYYMQEAGARVALGFIDRLETAYGAISRQPAAGSPRYAHELALSGLRSWKLRGYPYLIFYVERADVIDVWRVLHAQRDVAAWMSRE
jgi:toxin ParE1/3/4